MDRALLITRNLPPLMGGMERLIWHIAKALGERYQLKVVGPKGCSEHFNTARITTAEVSVTPMWLFFIQALCKSLFLAVVWRPKLVFAGSGLTAPFAWLSARLCGAQCTLYLHGLDIESDHPVYQRLWIPFFKRFDRIMVNSHFTLKTALEKGINASKIEILHPGVEIPSSNNADSARTRFRQRYKLGQSPIMLYIGRITERKGLAVFTESVLPTIARVMPDAHVVVIGDESDLSLLKSESQLSRVRRALEKAGLEDSVHFLGAKSHDDPEIEDAYFAADVHIFPAQHKPGDQEGFGMVAIEAAAHGLPTVAFDTGGISDAVKDGVSGRLIHAGDNKAFAEAVIAQLHCHDAACSPDTCRSFAIPFSWNHFVERLLKLVQRR